MNVPILMRSLSPLALRFLSVLLASALKASLSFAVVYAVTRLLKEARSRHLLWLSALLSYLLVLAISLFDPILPLGSPGPRGPSGISGVLSSVLLPQAGLLTAANTPAPPLFGLRPAAEAARGGTRLWPQVLFLLWCGGVLASSLRFVVGKIRLLQLTHGAKLPFSPRRQSYWNELLARNGAPRRVRLLVSTRWQAAFTRGTVRPLIVLPADMVAWPRERLRAVLLHELRHIQRLDCLTQAVAYAVCSLFWFVPFAWVAFAHLYLEQEKACDAEVLEQGVVRREYAGCLLEAARLCLEPAAAIGFIFPGRRKKMLVDRIHHILRGGKDMKKKAFALLTAAFAVCSLIVLSAGAGQETIDVEDAYGKIVGEWVNMKYPGVTPQSEPQKIVIRPDHTGEDWRTASDPARDAAWDLGLKKAWKDWKGSIYIQFYYRYTERYSWSGPALFRLSRNGRVLEQMDRPGLETGVYPEKINPKARSDEGDWYSVYYRQ